MSVGHEPPSLHFFSLNFPERNVTATHYVINSDAMASEGLQPPLSPVFFPPFEVLSSATGEIAVSSRLGIRNNPYSHLSLVP